MEYVREDATYSTGRSGTITRRIRELEDELSKANKQLESRDKSRQFRFPFRWMWKFNQSFRKAKTEMALVLFFNKKNQIEVPMFVPIFSGNMIVYKDKAYEFDPRAIWHLKGVRKHPMVYCIREIDRRPIKNPDGTYKIFRGRKIYSQDAAISNMDIDEVRARGDSTESDEFLIKAALKAQTSKLPVKGNWVIAIVVILIIVGGLVWLLSSGGGA
jgi:hypothetical protein